MKSPKCYCLNCNGKTIKKGRESLEKDIKWMVDAGLITEAYGREMMQEFLAYHLPMMITKTA